jgi:hypothetical protein
VGKSTGARDLVVGHSPSKELRVEDESGDGVLDMDAALLDVEVRETRMKLADPLLEKRVGKLDRHESHIEYVVTEEVVRPGEQLYVLGEVVRVALQAGDGGYRGVRGSPTLSGPDAPLLVYAGTERGLLDELGAEDRALGLVIALATGACVVLGAAVVGLAAL